MVTVCHRWRSTPRLRETEQIFSQTSLRAQGKVPDERPPLSSALPRLRRGRKSPSLQQQRTVKTSRQRESKKISGDQLAEGSLLTHRCRKEMIALTVVLHVQPFFCECAQLPPSACNRDDNDLSLNAPLMYIKCGRFPSAPPLYASECSKNHDLLRGGAGCPPFPVFPGPPGLSLTLHKQVRKSSRSSRLDVAAALIHQKTDPSSAKPPAPLQHTGIHTVQHESLPSL